MLVYSTKCKTVKYIPEFSSPELFEPLLESLEPFCYEHKVRFMGKEHPSPRIGCFFCNDPEIKYIQNGVDVTKNLPFSIVPIMQSLLEQVKEYTDVEFNGALVWIYRDGKDYISWHNDKEALDPKLDHVFSLSFGDTRRFLLRDFGRTKGEPNYEFRLKGGDAIYMYNGCQKLYKHSVPKQANAKTRINITFRKFE